ATSDIDVWPLSIYDRSAGCRRLDRRSAGTSAVCRGGRGPSRPTGSSSGRRLPSLDTISNFYYLVAPARGRIKASDFPVDVTRFARQLLFLHGAVGCLVLSVVTRKGRRKRDAEIQVPHHRRRYDGGRRSEGHPQSGSQRLDWGDWSRVSPALR